MGGRNIDCRALALVRVGCSKPLARVATLRVDATQGERIEPERVSMVRNIAYMRRTRVHEFSQRESRCCNRGLARGGALAALLLGRAAAQVRRERGDTPGCTAIAMHPSATVDRT